MLLTVLLLGVGVSVIVYNFVRPAKQSIERDRITAAALAQARDALIGRAAADNTRPGSLPCPDVDNDGALIMGIDYGGGGACTSNIGRLPWRTLGLPDLRDGSGERLWYAVSNNFQDASGVTINSETAGQLTITGTTPAANVIGIVFAPGAAVGTQLRDASNQYNVSNYLEGENSNGDMIYTTAPASSTFNDQLIPITREALFPVVEMRIARELRLSLLNYFYEPLVTPRQYYPLAAMFGVSPNYVPSSGTYRGYLPTASTGCSVLPDLAPYLPAWFTTNNWQQLVVYAVAPGCTPKINSIFQTLAPTDPQPPCAFSCPTSGFRTCEVVQSIDASASNCNNPPGALLTVNGDPTIRAIVMPASYRLVVMGVTQARPCNTISQCLEAVSGANPNENIDADNVYVKPVRSATNNDSLVIVAPP
jgi:hypothetical protein